jgi:hypothetical protein
LKVIGGPVNANGYVWWEVGRTNPSLLTGQPIVIYEGFTPPLIILQTLFGVFLLPQ